MNIKKGFKEAIELVKKENKLIKYIALTMLLFAILGFVFPGIFFEQIKGIIETLMGAVENMSTLELIFFIIQNNIKVAFLAIILGVFGFLPIIAVTLNGYLLGAVFSLAAIEQGYFVIWRILPHGIFELPALIIAFAFSFRIFLDLFNKQNIFEHYKNAFKVFIYIIVPLLIIAGIIEGLLVSLV